MNMKIYTIYPYLLLFCFVDIGCSTKPNDQQRLTNATLAISNYPESAILKLSTEQQQAIEKQSQSVSIPDDLSIPQDISLRDEYLRWYRRGYAYVMITGFEHPSGQYFPSNASRQAVINAWLAGNRRAALDKRKIAINNSIDGIIASIRKSTNTSNLSTNK